MVGDRSGTAGCSRTVEGSNDGPMVAGGKGLGSACGQRARVDPGTDTARTPGPVGGQDTTVLTGSAVPRRPGVLLRAARVKQ